MLTFLGPALLCLAVLHLAAVALLALRPGTTVRGCVAGLAAAGVLGVALTTVLLPDRPVFAAAVTAALVVAGVAAYGGRRTDLHAAGAATWVTWLAFGMASSVWGVQFLLGLALSWSTAVLLWVAAGIGLLTLPSTVITTREGWEVLLRRTWSRPRTPVAARRFPMVSIQVPCHAEPPDVVIETLDRLAALDYPDFEVLVIDNNTADETLWRPLEAHCEKLGRRFRFLHVEGITGAKAGALNWALPHVDPAAELFGIVDADYHVEPHWLLDTVGHFEDPAMGIVQTPHAYRDFAHSRFGRWADAEYAVFFATGMVALNEHNAGLTVGTMSLIRRQALQDAGGWSEWCLTEDSELAIRIHAAGYDSVYLPQPYGRGLIPETFEVYRKQRFRWTYGPVQEIQRHWRLFLPTALGGTPSALTASQKLHHANHGIDVMGIGLRMVALVVGAAAGVSMIVTGDRIHVPVELWGASTTLMVGALTLRCLVYTRAVRAGWAEAVGGSIAFAALALVIGVASLRATLRRPATWQRTAKFRVASAGMATVNQARGETGLAVGSITAAAAMIATSSGGIVTMLAIGVAVQALTYATAPVLALVADKSLATHPHPSHPQLSLPTASRSVDDRVVVAV